MLISLPWLRELVPSEATTEEIARALTARGLTVDAVLDEVSLDLDVPANRPDCLGHKGVARELAAALGVSVARRGGVVTFKGGPRATVEASVRVEVSAPELCGRYTAGIVHDVTVGPSPDWVVARLAECGLRSIDNVVDASNLVMLELGQPVHFFDLARLAGPAIVVRRARAGERLVTLDGVPRTLSADELVIADAERAVALAGVMGGAETEIAASTRTVLVEAAWFSPAAVRRTARRQALTTDASQRFARGTDPEAPAEAQFLAGVLLNRLAGGVPARGLLDLRAAAPPRRTITVRLARAETLLGFAPDPEEATRALEAIGLAPTPSPGGLEITVPSWRVDVEREADVVEEIGRALGYDRVPSRTPPSAPRETVSPPPPAEETARDRLAALGFRETMSYAMIAAGEDDPFVGPGAPAAMPILNPIASTLTHLRRSLLPGLLRVTDLNVRHGLDEVRAFEVGRTFRARAAGALPTEPLHAGFAWCGAATPRHWSAPARAVDLNDAAGIVEDLLATVTRGAAFARERGHLAGLHPGRSICWRDGSGAAVAWCGLPHPELAAALEAKHHVLLGEVDLDRAAAAATPAAAYRPVPRVPAVARDLSIVLSAGRAAGEILAALSRVDAPAPASFSWIDRYEGAPLGPGEVAMTLRVILTPLERTLTDAETEAFRRSLLDALEAVPGARLRRIDT